MGRAKVTMPIDGMEGWFMVADDLGNSYPVQSAVADFNFVAGEHYRLFVPDGRYSPCDSRLLPYRTSKRWASASELAKSKPATASAMYLWGERMGGAYALDRKKVISKIAYGLAYFQDASCALLPQEHSYSVGDCVAVIHDLKDEKNCLLPRDGEPWVAGYGCGQKPKTGCASRNESWSGYSPSTADIENGGGHPNEEDDHPGYFIFSKIKTDPLDYEVWDNGSFQINRWDVKLSDIYVKEGFPFGIPAGIAVNGGSLAVETAVLEEGFTVARDDYASVKFPRPIYFQKSDSPIIISPPVAVSSEVSIPLFCSGKDLNMSVNLFTSDTYDHYIDVDGYGTGLQLPACMILTFSKAPYPDYLDGSTINTSWYTSEPGMPAYSSVCEVNLDLHFSLLYVSPGSADFSSLRTSLPSAHNGRFGLFRSKPRRDAEGHPIGFASGLLTDMAFNVPMSGDENDFDNIGNLLMRCFDSGGADVTPPPSPSGEYGVFPGYFEINSGSDVIRNIAADFSAAYPFVFNEEVNPERIFPKLSKISFYAQGKIHDIDYSPGGVSFRANPVKLECKNLEFFYL